MALASHIRLREKYRLEKVLGQDGPFDTTYLAIDLSSEQPVTVREYFPAELAERADDGRHVQVPSSNEGLFYFGKEQFLKEGAVLRRMNHPNIIREIGAFEDNGTAYRVAEYHEGATLGTVLANRTRPLRLTAAFRVMKAVLSSLHAAHQSGLIHGGISPDTIFLDKEGKPMLFGFRIGRILLANELGTLAGGIDGFTAPEQTTPNGKQGPWSDIYASAAVLAYLLTGRSIPDPERRLSDEGSLFEDTDLALPFQDVLTKALDLDPAGRPRSVPAFKQMLIEAVQAVQQATEDVETTPEPSREVDDPAPGPHHTAESEVDGAQDEDESSARHESSYAAAAHDEVDADATEREAPEPESGEEWEAPTVAEESITDSESAPPPAQMAEYFRTEHDVEEAVEHDDIRREPGERQPSATPHAYEDETEPAGSVRSQGEIEAEEEDLHEEPVSEATEDIAEPQTEPAVAEAHPEGDEASTDVDVEDDRAPERSKQQSSRTRRAPRTRKLLVSGLGVTVLVLLIGLGYVFTSSVALGTGGSGSPGFGVMKAQGDSLFEQGNYAQAATFYQQALMARPDDDYISTRLTESERRIYDARESQFEMYLDEGDELLLRADSLLSADDAGSAMSAFDEASRTYLQALPYRPDDPDLLARMDRASRGMNEAYLLHRQQTDDTASAAEEPDPQEVQQELFRVHLAEAEERWGREDYEGARRRLADALELRPDDPTVLARMDELDGLLAEQADAEAFDRHVDRAEEMLSQNRFAEALVELDRALELRPDAIAVRARKAEVESRQTEQREREEQYSYFRAQGDLLQSEERHQEAIQSYRNALQFRPDDGYVTEQIGISEQWLEQHETEERRASLMRGDVYLVTEEPPQLTGGLSDLYSNIRYPRAAREAGVQGRVYVQFVVAEDGSVESPSVLRGIGYGCDEEAIRVIEQARFQPGRIDGEPVRAQHTLMIEFRLMDDEDDDD